MAQNRKICRLWLELLEAVLAPNNLLAMDGFGLTDTAGWMPWAGEQTLRGDGSSLAAVSYGLWGRGSDTPPLSAQLATPAEAAAPIGAHTSLLMTPAFRENMEGDLATTTSLDDFLVRTWDADALATITVNAAPIANDDSPLINEADLTPITGNVLDNDYDPDGDPLTVSAVNGIPSYVGVPVAGTYGSLQINADSSYTYNLDYESEAVLALPEGQEVTDHFTYTVSDGQGGTATANQDIRINPNRIRMTISFAPIDYRQGQNPPVRIAVTVNSRTPNTRIVIKLDRLTGTTVPYYRTGQGEDELDEATTPIVTDANGRVTVYIPVDRLPTGVHTFVAGRRTADGGIDTSAAPLPAMTSDHFRVLAP